MKLDPSTIAANLSAAAAAEAEVAAASQNNSSNMPMLTSSSSSSAPTLSANTNLYNQSNMNSSSSIGNQSQQSSISGQHHHSSQQQSTAQSNSTNMANNGAGTSQNKVTPKDFQVVAAILKEMGINDYEPRVLPQLVEFAYRYVGRVLEDAQLFSSHARKKIIDTDDVSLAIQMQIDRSFVGPPSRDILLEISRNKNTQPLPQIKSHNGMRLPADRYSLVSPNFRLVSKPTNSTILSSTNNNINNNKTIVRTVSSLLSTTPSSNNSKISIQSPILVSPTNNNIQIINNNQQQQQQIKTNVEFGKRKLDD